MLTEMDAFTTYQKEVMRTSGGMDMPGIALGVTGEAGEVADAVKKQVYHQVKEFGKNRVDFLTHIEEEIGDTLFYLAFLCEYLGLSLSTVARKNIEKLEQRYPNGFVLGGGIR